ncbi:hypothetical protein BSKO_02538 [Bryopsis sp. KO-2023]|nr:hypothetical protein BSKO_02538 [Bryopsis sp. KO-2023]
MAKGKRKRERHGESELKNEEGRKNENEEQEVDGNRATEALMTDGKKSRTSRVQNQIRRKKNKCKTENFFPR